MKGVVGFAPPAAPVRYVGDASKAEVSGGLMREATTCAGNAAKRLLATRSLEPLRSGVFVHNGDATYDLWVYASNDSALPTISASDRIAVIAPGGTLTLEVGSQVEVFVRNSSAAATTSAVVAQEFRRG